MEIEIEEEVVDGEWRIEIRVSYNGHAWSTIYCKSVGDVSELAEFLQGYVINRGFE